MSFSKMLPHVAIPIVLLTSPVQVHQKTRIDAASFYFAAYYHPIASQSAVFFADTAQKLPDRSLFWQSAEEIEMAEDIYERTKNPKYLKAVSALCEGFNSVVSKTPDWASWNQYNDDVMWACIAFTRAYQITHHRRFLLNAEEQFDKVWARGWDDTLGGGLWWSTKKQGKNACVNGPAAIAGILLAKNSGRQDYRKKAIAAFEWEKVHLFDHGTGQVFDNMSRGGSINRGAYTYNQGTFIGAAHLIDEDRKKQGLSEACYRAAKWTMANLCGPNPPEILLDEYNGDGSVGDGVGFKGIFMRWCSRWAKTSHHSEISSWLDANALAAWNCKNTAGLLWAKWGNPTPEKNVTSWECSSAIDAIEDAP